MIANNTSVPKIRTVAELMKIRTTILCGMLLAPLAVNPANNLDLNAVGLPKDALVGVKIKGLGIAANLGLDASSRLHIKSLPKGTLTIRPGAVDVDGVHYFPDPAIIKVVNDGKKFLIKNSRETLTEDLLTLRFTSSELAFKPLPPGNPYMGPEGTSTMHGNAASSDATYNRGPGAGPLTINQTSQSAVFPTILMGSDGLLVAVGTRYLNQTPYAYLLDPNSLAVLASMKLVKSTVSDLAGGIYSYLDAQNRLVLVNASGFLQRISHTQQSDGSWVLTVTESINIGYPDVVGLVPDYQGRVWFATAEGVSANTGAVVGYYDPSNGQISAFTLPAGEEVANSISSAPDGVAVASTYALYLFRAEGGAATQVWRQVYDRGPARKPGQLSWGTGATPTFFGPLTGYEYLTITDNAAPQENILVYNARSGKLIGSLPFLTANVNSGTEDSPIGMGNSIFVPSTYGYVYPPSATTGPSEPSSAPFVGGMQRVDVLPGGAGLTTIWSNQTLPSTSVPRLSAKDNLIYTVVVNQNTGAYSLVTVDPATGLPMSSTLVGNSSNDNTLQMVGTIAPGGKLYQGTINGLFSAQPSN